MMNKMKDLRAGVEEMRSVAQKLLMWASDLEESFQQDAPAEPPAEAPEPPAEAPDAAAPAPTLAEVQDFLTTQCAAGYSAQVKALIASFGVSKLSAVPAESLGALMEAAALLGAGGEPDAG